MSISRARTGDRHVYAARTRFIPRGLLPLFESVSWAPTPAEGDAARVRSTIQLDLGAKMRGMWAALVSPL